MEITPAILSKDEKDFHDKLFHSELRKVAKTFHIDVLNDTLVAAKCWGDPDTIKTWEGLPDLELHLMTHDPVRQATYWKTRIPEVKSVIFHAEAVSNLRRSCEQLKLMKLGVTIAINPETSVDVFLGLEDVADELLVMGVPPGASGQELLFELTLAKLRRTRALSPHVCLCVDGGVKKTNIRAIAEAGATRAVTSSAIWASPNPEEALAELHACAMIDA